LLIGAALCAAAVLVPSIASATPDQPAPNTVASVQKRLDDLTMKNAHLVENFNQARNDVTRLKKAADKAQVAATQAAADFEQARIAVSATMAAEYENGSFSATGALLSSADGRSYLDDLQTLDMISTHAAQVARQVQTAKTHADAAGARATTLLKAATVKRDALDKQRTSLDKDVAKYTALLSTLTAAQRTTFQLSIAPPVPQAMTLAAAADVLSAPAAVQKAIAFAGDQVGKPYVFGAAGPDSYDCSGLTMASYAAAGISLPHSAADQYNYGTHVALNQLQPGDLIFYYSPISHVTIYVGAGMMISASTEGVPISKMAVSAMSGAVGATRIIG
jgi:cell wall-associated NlpC family hydrolase